MPNIVAVSNYVFIITWTISIKEPLFIFFLHERKPVLKQWYPLNRPVIKFKPQSCERMLWQV